jgi:osmotically-inducible protein OsmY
MGGGLSIEMWRADDGGTDVAGKVWDELAWEPVLCAEDVKLDVHGNRVILTGSVHSYPEKLAAGRAASRVRGVQRVHNDLVVVPPHLPDDAAIAQAATSAFAADVLLSRFALRVTVRGGWVEIAGQVDRAATRRTAQAVIERLIGVTGLTNLITIAPVAARDVAARATAALRRCGGFTRRHVRVEARGETIVVRGRARSLAEREKALQAVGDVVGVGEVVDQTHIAA